MRDVQTTPVATQAGEMSLEALHGYVGGMGVAGKIQVSRVLPSQWGGGRARSAVAAATGSTPAAAGCPGGICRPKSGGVWG